MLVMQEPAGDPECSGGRKPCKHPEVVAIDRPVVLLRGKNAENGPAEMHCHIGRCEDQSGIAEGIGNGAGEKQSDQHLREQEKPYRRPFRVEPVGAPCRVDPDGPDHHQQHGAMKQAGPVEMRDQRMRYLRDREHKNQVEKQFGKIDTCFLARCEFAQQSGLKARHAHDLHP